MARIGALKGIGTPRGFVALAASAEMVELWVERDARALGFLRAIWPAALTAVVTVRRPVPWGESRAGSATAAFRVPAHGRLRELVAAVGEPLVSTSANRSGDSPLEDPAAIVETFGAGLDVVVIEPPGSGAVRALRPSTVADCTAWPPRLLRPGEFDLEAAVRAWSGR